MALRLADLASLHEFYCPRPRPAHAHSRPRPSPTLTPSSTLTHSQVADRLGDLVSLHEGLGSGGPARLDPSASPAVSHEPGGFGAGGLAPGGLGPGGVETDGCDAEEDADADGADGGGAAGAAAQRDLARRFDESFPPSAFGAEARGAAWAALLPIWQRVRARHLAPLQARRGLHTSLHPSRHISLHTSRCAPINISRHTSLHTSPLSLRLAAAEFCESLPSLLYHTSLLYTSLIHTALLHTSLITHAFTPPGGRSRVLRVPPSRLSFHTSLITHPNHTGLHISPHTSLRRAAQVAAAEFCEYLRLAAGSGAAEASVTVPLKLLRLLVKHGAITAPSPCQPQSQPPSQPHAQPHSQPKSPMHSQPHAYPHSQPHAQLDSYLAASELGRDFARALRASPTPPSPRFYTLHITAYIVHTPSSRIQVPSWVATSPAPSALRPPPHGEASFRNSSRGCPTPTHPSAPSCTTCFWVRQLGFGEGGTEKFHTYGRKHCWVSRCRVSAAVSAAGGGGRGRLQRRRAPDSIAAPRNLPTPRTKRKPQYSHRASPEVVL